MSLSGTRTLKVKSFNSKTLNLSNVYKEMKNISTSMKVIISSYKFQIMQKSYSTSSFINAVS